MAKRARKTYTTQKRSEILAAAQRENLTANDVKRKFGVTPVTYYSWRKKEGLVGRRGRRPSRSRVGRVRRAAPRPARSCCAG